MRDVDERRARARVVEEVGQQIRLQVRVHHDDNGAAAEDPEERADEWRAVRQRDDDALLRPDVRLVKDAGERAG